MARKKRASRDSGAAILRAAAHEFSERGYDAARVDRIALRARVNKAMLYYHYGSKQGLYVAILRDMFGTVAGRLRPIADGPGLPSQKLDAVIAALVDEASARPWFPPVMLRELASGGAHFDRETLGIMNSVYGAIHDLIVEGQRKGEFHDVDPLLFHLTVMPTILCFFARQRVIATTKTALDVAAPRGVDAFVQHMQRSVRRILGKD